MENNEFSEEEYKKAVMMIKCGYKAIMCIT